MRKTSYIHKVSWESFEITHIKEARKYLNCNIYKCTHTRAGTRSEKVIIIYNINIQIQYNCIFYFLFRLYVSGNYDQGVKYMKKPFSDTVIRVVSLKKETVLMAKVTQRN